MSYQIIRTGADNHGELSPNSDSKKIEFSSSRVSNAPSKISKIQLINKINYLNFQDEPIIVNMRHNKYNHIVSLKANPEPCLGDELSCKWEDQTTVERILKNCSFDSIVIRNNTNELSIKLDLIEINTERILFELRDIHFLDIEKQTRKYNCKNTNAKLIQNGVVFSGILLNFSSTSFSIILELKPPQTHQWINFKSSVFIILLKNNEMFYSGECSIIEGFTENHLFSLSLEPKNFSRPRFKPKNFRSIREELIPSPSIIFLHPLTDKWYDLKVLDLSGSGFSIKENEKFSALIPGLIIPEIEMIFATGYKIKFKAQIVYRYNLANEDRSNFMKYGFAIIDITINEHRKLMAFLHNAKDENMYIGEVKDLNELWNFFFQSGFIYPKKFNHIYSKKKLIKETYEKLYIYNPDIIRHFIYKKNGRINAHMSSIRYYQNSWLIHHHAARKSSFKSGGLSVLNQVGRFINDSHRLYSANMQYVFCYFRDNNKFPNRVFGGAARNLKNLQACSLDSFLYFTFTPSSISATIPFTWELLTTNQEDLDELSSFYNYYSGGLLLNALNLYSLDNNLNELQTEFNKAGLIRERHLFSLKKGHNLKALFMINISNLGLNLSDLTNSITVFILDSNELAQSIILSVVKIIVDKFSMADVPVMIYPENFLNTKIVNSDTIYNLWILNANYTDNYFRYLKRLLKFIQY